MSENGSVVQFNGIRKMLDNDQEAIKEFCDAARISFSSFQQEFRNSMQNRDLESLQKVGHRIKPVAQMLGIDRLVDLYYEAKEVLKQGIKEKVETVIQKMDQLCEQILEEFNQKA